MTEVATEGGLQVSCAQPECHWKGPAADAPGHDCPTPELAAESGLGTEGSGSPVVTPPAPFAGITGQDGTPIADELADTALPYHVIWTGEDGTIVRVGTAATEDGALEIEAMTDKGKGSVEVRYIGEPDAQATVIEEAFEPETHGDVAAWLVNWGKYSEEGVPEDEKTARLDAKLTSLEGEGDEEPGGGQPAPDPEPEVEEDEQIAASGSVASDEVEKQEVAGQTVDPGAEIPGTPWEVKVASVLEQQGQVAAYRWLIVDTATGELIGRAKVKTEGKELLENVKRDIAEKPDAALTLELVKTQDVLARAEEIQIERKRQMVPPEEPAQTPASPTEPEGSEDGDEAPAEEPKPENLKDVKPATGNGKKETKLFDDSDFEREDLALPKVDGHGIDRIAIAFSGQVLLDRSNPDHVALWRRLKLGTDVDLMINVRSLGNIGKGMTNKDGDLDVVVAQRPVTVQTVRAISAEQMAAAIAEIGAQARDAHEAGEDA